ncbi:MAG: helix-turn-helix domain containing protein [Acidithiobacillus sp.]|nr:helix-turn-helix domain containing protein [Acidithiobacillus sp.]
MIRAAYLVEDVPFLDHTMDIQAQREADYRDNAEDECADPALADWCTPARLMREFADPDLGVRFLREHDYLACDDDQLYLTEKQEANRHDRVMVDVPRTGRRKGGTHGLAPENRRRRSAKVINQQLLRWDASGSDCIEAEGFYHTVNAKISRAAGYVLSVYKGKHADVLTLMLAGKSTLEIAEKLGKSTRRVRQIVNGHAQRNAPGLRQFISETLMFGVPSYFPGTPPVVVATSSPKAKKAKPVHQKRQHVVKEVAA